jgi:hypothetical protein
MGLYLPHGSTTYVRRPDADDGVERPPPATPEQLGAPAALVAGELDDGRARMMRGRNGAAGAIKAESDRRGWGLSGDQCTERAGAARGRADRRKGG